MKKLLSFILSMALLLTLCSCDLLFGKVDDSGKVTVVVENTDGGYDVYEASLEEVENKNEGAMGILEHLSKQKNSLHIKTTDGGYGAYVTEIGSIKENSSAGKYVMVYTSVASDSYEGAPTVDYEGKTLYQSGVGISGIKIEADTIILFRLESY